MPTRIFYVFFLAVISFFSCNDYSPVIKAEESADPPLTKQDSLQLRADSVSLAQNLMRDSLQNEGWYSFSSFGLVNREYGGGLEDYDYSILVPVQIDSFIYFEGLSPKLLGLRYETNENELEIKYL